MCVSVSNQVKDTGWGWLIFQNPDYTLHIDSKQWRVTFNVLIFLECYSVNRTEYMAKTCLIVSNLINSRLFLVGGDCGGGIWRKQQLTLRGFVCRIKVWIYSVDLYIEQETAAHTRINAHAHTRLMLTGETSCAQVRSATGSHGTFDFAFHCLFILVLCLSPRGVRHKVQWGQV